LDLWEASVGVREPDHSILGKTVSHKLLMEKKSYVKVDSY